MDYHKIINEVQGISKLTKELYIGKLQSLSRLMKKDINYILEHRDEVIKFLETMKNPRLADGKQISYTTQKSYVSAIVGLLKHAGLLTDPKYSHWRDKYIEMSRATDDEMMSRVATDRQNKSYVDWDTIVRVRDSLDYGSNEHLFLCIYSMIPPVRADYGEVKFYKGTPKNDMGNHIILGKKPKVVLQDYKTAKTYGKIETPIPPELNKVITTSLQQRPRKHLFESMYERPFSKSSNFISFANNMLRKIFKNEYISLTTLRHSYIKWIDNEFENQRITYTQRKEIARQMGHDFKFSTAQLYNLKYDSN